MKTPPKAADVVIIGGGIIGLSTGYQLARRGAKTLVIEKDSGPMQASVRNAGGIRAQCRNPTERRLAMASIEMWEKLAADTGRDFEYRKGGNLRLAKSMETLESLAHEAGDEEADGLQTEMWNTANLRQRAPHISTQFIGAKYCATDGHANPILATWAMLEAATTAGAELLFSARATGFDLDGDQITGVWIENELGRERIATSSVVHAAGPWTTKLAAQIGVQLPISPQRNAILVTQPLPPLFPEFISSHDLQIYLRQSKSGHVHVGGVFTTPNTFDLRVSSQELARLASFGEMVPQLGGVNILRAWSGTLDMTLDHLPLLGRPSAVRGYVVAAGFSGHGFCLGPVVGRVASDLALDGSTPFQIANLHPDRFTNQQATT